MTEKIDPMELLEIAPNLHIGTYIQERELNALLSIAGAAYKYRYGIGPNPKAALDYAIGLFDWNAFERAEGIK